MNRTERSRRRHNARRLLAHLFALHGKRCYWCGVALVDASEIAQHYRLVKASARRVRWLWADGTAGEAHAATVDHVVGVAEGGPDHLENLVPACGSCNNARSNPRPNVGRPCRQCGKPRGLTGGARRCRECRQKNARAWRETGSPLNGKEKVMVLHTEPTHAERVAKLPPAVREFWQRARKHLDATHNAMCEALLSTCEAMAHHYPADLQDEEKAVLLALDRYVCSRRPKAA